MNYKKAQISSQVFIYILAVVILSITMLFGYNMIDRFRKNAEFSTINDFENQIKLSVNELSNEYQSIKREKFILPQKIKYLCIADSNIKHNKNHIISRLALYNPNIISSQLKIILEDSFESNILKNIFLTDSNEIIHSFFINNTQIWEIDAPDCDDFSKDSCNIYFRCFENTNNIEIIFYGAGNKVRIAKDTT
ncbi:hypothetical protein GF327_02230 [Candidatus Woesearchaeota archaeon]|nr:hypothetical protein [Candidatus Woesearchaeota archaeon]